MAYVVKAYIVMAYVVMPYVVKAYVVMAYVVMTYVVMAYVVMAYVVMPYVVMALYSYGLCSVGLGRNGGDKAVAVQACACASTRVCPYTAGSMQSQPHARMLAHTQVPVRRGRHGTVTTQAITVEAITV